MAELPPLNEETMEPIPENPVVPLDDDPEFPDPPGPAIMKGKPLCYLLQH